MLTLRKPIFIESAFVAPFCNEAMQYSLQEAVKWLFKKDIEANVKENTITILQEILLLNNALSQKSTFPEEYACKCLDKIYVFSPKAKFCGIECVVCDKYLVNYDNIQEILRDLFDTFSNLYFENRDNEDRDKFWFVYEFLKNIYQDNQAMYEV